LMSCFIEGSGARLPPPATKDLARGLAVAQQAGADAFKVLLEDDAPAVHTRLVLLHNASAGPLRAVNGLRILLPGAVHKVVLTDPDVKAAILQLRSVPSAAGGAWANDDVFATATGAIGAAEAELVLSAHAIMVRCVTADNDKALRAVQPVIRARRPVDGVCPRGMVKVRGGS
jgi:hypothetical protein